MNIYLSLTTPALPSLRASGAPAQGRRRELGDAERRPCDAFSRLEGGPAVRPLPRAQEEALLVLGFCGTVQEKKREDALGLAGSGCQGSAGSQDCWDGRPQTPQQEGVRPFGPRLRQKADIWAPEECSKVVDICWFHTSLL